MDSSTDNLIIKTETYAQIAEPAPFSLKGLKETLTRPLIYYEKFVNVNGSAIEGIESSLRSLSYILPGRFKDSEFVSEICNHNLLVYHKIMIYVLLLIILNSLYTNLSF